MKCRSYCFVLLTLLLPLSSSAQEYFDEIYDSKGRVRTEYVEAVETHSEMSKTQIKKYLKETKKIFKGDNALDPMPRIISQEEFDDVLKKGVEQRAKALQLFLKDYFSGTKHYLKGKVIPESVLNNLTERSQEKQFLGKVNPNSVSFFYGPDIIRDAKGQWRVIEDNPGFIGGIGDLKLAQEIMLSKNPELADEIRFKNADEFYDKVAERYKLIAKENGGIAVILMAPPYADNEDYRIKKIFAERGILTVTPYTKMQLKVTDNGVFIYDSTKQRPRYIKVGHAYINGDHYHFDSHSKYVYEKVIKNQMLGALEDSSESKVLKRELQSYLSENTFNANEVYEILKKYSKHNRSIHNTNLRSFRGIIDSVVDGKISSNYTPGLDFIGDKEFYLYVENMIRFYLKEEPILKNIPTKRFGQEDTQKLDNKLFDHVFNNLEKYVIKKVDGRGGDAVWVGPKIKREEIPLIKERILSAPAEYIAQEYTPLSRLNDNIVDIRVITDVSPKGIYVTNTPWGRGLPADGNGKVNLSDLGRETTVLIHQGSWKMCKNIFAR